MGFWGELDGSNVVTRVVVAGTDPTALLGGGPWQETSDPYTPAGDPRTYAGPGYTHDAVFVEEFAPAWIQPTGAQDPDLLTWDAYDLDALAGHNGSIWRSLANYNIWEPGVTNWREQPVDGSAPAWIQPTGAEDAYDTGEQVTHTGETWSSNIDANTTEPGVDPTDQFWAPQTVPDNETEWAEPRDYLVADIRFYADVQYSCLQAHTSIVGWEPPNVPALWTPTP